MVGGNIDGKRSRLYIPMSGASLAVLSSRQEPTCHIVLSDGMSMLANMQTFVEQLQCNMWRCDGKRLIINSL